MSESIREALQGWEARDAGEGQSSVERGTGTETQYVVGPIPYERAEQIEDFIEHLTKLVDAEHEHTWVLIEEWVSQEKAYGRPDERGYHTIPIERRRRFFCSGCRETVEDVDTRSDPHRGGWKTTPNVTRV